MADCSALRCACTAGSRITHIPDGDIIEFKGYDPRQYRNGLRFDPRVRRVGRNSRSRWRRNYFASASAVNVAEIEAEIRALRPQVATLLTLGIHSSADCSMGFGRFGSGRAFLIGATPVLHVRHERVSARA